LTIGSAQL